MTRTHLTLAAPSLGPPAHPAPALQSPLYPRRYPISGRATIAPDRHHYLATRYLDATTTSPRGARPTTSQRVSGQPPPAPAVCTSQRTNAAWHVNGTQQPPSCRPAGGLAGFEPHGSVSDTPPRACVIRCPNKLPIPDTHHEGASSISRPGGTAGWLWNFRLDDVGRWYNSELPSLGGLLTTTTWASNSKSSPAAFSARRLTRKTPGTTRRLDHPTLLLGGPGYDRGRLNPVPGPGAGNHDSPIALLPPHLPRAPRPGRLPAGPAGATRRPGRRARDDASSPGLARST